MSSQNARRENANGLAGRRVGRRNNPELSFPARPSRAALPEPLTPEDLEIARRAHAVTTAATDRILSVDVQVNGKGLYDARREGRGEYHDFLCWLVGRVNAGMSESEYLLFSTDLEALGRIIYKGTMRRTLAEIRALETRYQGECDTLMMDTDRRIAAGEPETAAMHDAQARAYALHAVHAIEGVTAHQARAAELRRAETVKAQRATLTVVTE